MKSCSPTPTVKIVASVSRIRFSVWSRVILLKVSIPEASTRTAFLPLTSLMRSSTSEMASKRFDSLNGGK